MDNNKDLITLGWREWVRLPDLGIKNIKAKVDTGARTSAIHAFELETFSEAGREKVAFRIHPLQHDEETIVTCVTDILDKRVVTDSGGHKEERIVIATTLDIGSYTWPIEATLTSRDTMLFRMLLGRTAIKSRAQVDPARSYLVGKKKKANKA
ncbi:MAG: RimK/LysX family protein [Woeseiaceae bacterium]|nr:RimK/LysX family protein [Woeseiaceae bacterium]